MATFIRIFFLIMVIVAMWVFVKAEFPIDGDNQPRLRANRHTYYGDLGAILSRGKRDSWMGELGAMISPYNSRAANRYRHPGNDGFGGIDNLVQGWNEG